MSKFLSWLNKVYTWVASFAVAAFALNMLVDLLRHIPASWVDAALPYVIIALAWSFADFALKHDAEKRAAKAAAPTLQQRQ